MYIDLDPSQLSAREIYRIMTSVLVPRPIAWVSSVDSQGCANLAPFSFYTLVSTDPALIALSISDVRGRQKDTASNILATKEFVINFVTVELMGPMHASSAHFEAGVDEAEALGIGMISSLAVKPCSVAKSPVHLECRLIEALEFGKQNSRLLVGEVIRFRMAERLFEEGKINGAMLEPLCRLGGPWYASLSERITPLIK